MTLADHFEALKKLIVQRRDKTALADAAGLHPNTLAAAKGDSWNPRIKTAIALERALNDVKRTYVEGPEK